MTATFAGSAGATLPLRAVPEGPVAGFADGIDQLLAELARLDAELSRLVLRRHRSGRLAGDPDYRGLYVPDAAVDALLHPPELTGDPELTEADALVATAAAGVAGRLAATPAAACLPLEQLTARFGLTPLERDVLLLAVAPELDVRYRSLLGWLQDDATLRHPTLALVADLWGGPARGRLAIVAAFARGNRLAESGLLTLFGADGTPLPSQELRTDRRLVAYLLGEETVDPRLGAHADVLGTAEPPAALHRPAAVTAALSSLARDLGDGGTAVVYGPPGSGRTTAATSVAAATSRPVLRVDGRGGAALLPVAVREARLRGAALVVRHADECRGDGGFTDVLAATTAMGNAGLPVVLTAASPWHRQIGGDIWRDVELGPLDYESRRRLWSATLERAGLATGEAAVAEVAGTFQLGPGRIAAASARAAASPPAPSGVEVAVLRAAARAVSADGLSGLARRIDSPYTWDDLVLAPRARRQLEEILGAARHGPRVREQYGFVGERGLHLLFAGPSGTGKTMAAGLLAAELGVDLYAVDLATTVSKYLGETEKNLDRVFVEGRAANAMLFFDEADALFGRRSEVKDAHDRYANVEVAYLLQRIEAYDGVTVLATNLHGNLDPAFARRLRYVVEFAAPDADLRATIWHRALPEALPRTADVDTDFLARQVELTGAAIRGAAHAAALLAAARGEPVAMADLVRAVARELDKVGRAPTRAEFGPWWDVLTAEAEAPELFGERRAGPRISRNNSGRGGGG